MGDDFIVHPVLPLCFTVSYSLCTFMSINRYSPLFQYYEMSYGLNIEMHKQVSQDSLSFCTPTPISKLCIFLLYYHFCLPLPSISSKTVRIIF